MQILLGRMMDLFSEQITNLNEKEICRGKYVLYWMQQSQRAHDNPALNYAIAQANQLKLPIIVLFVITNEFPEANLRHYQFMLEGIYETLNTLSNSGIYCAIVMGNIVKVVTRCSVNAALLITDKGYLRIQRKWRAEIAEQVDCLMTEVEGDTLFGVEKVMQEEAYNARSIRSRIYKFLPDYNIAPFHTLVVQNKLPEQVRTEFKKSLAELVIFSDDNVYNLHSFAEQVKGHFPDMDYSVLPARFYCGGYIAAKGRLTYFIDKILNSFFERRSDPGEDNQSGMSPYLQFGQISMREILREVISTLGISNREFLNLVLSVKPGEHQDSGINSALELFEEAVVRRELSMNFCRFNPDYDSFSCLPGWAQNTLKEHAADKRKYTYSDFVLEKAETHDKYWNAAQKELNLTGKMHGYMRMYWGKKILEWSKRPEDAFQVALYLNNKYELDGRDPNGFAGIAWCFGKHDRPWANNPIFGNIRTMTDSGLKKKFDMQAYLDRIEKL
jgi:deoxyribodipyrimidine photo-lyase